MGGSLCFRFFLLFFFFFFLGGGYYVFFKNHEEVGNGDSKDVFAKWFMLLFDKGTKARKARDGYTWFVLRVKDCFVQFLKRG